MFKRKKIEGQVKSPVPDGEEYIELIADAKSGYCLGKYAVVFTHFKDDFYKNDTGDIFELISYRDTFSNSSLIIEKQFTLKNISTGQSIELWESIDFKDIKKYVKAIYRVLLTREWEKKNGEKN